MSPNRSTVEAEAQRLLDTIANNKFGNFGFEVVVHDGKIKRVRRTEDISVIPDTGGSYGKPQNR